MIQADVKIVCVCVYLCVCIRMDPFPDPKVLQWPTAFFPPNK